jgi:hypothetical protein
MSLSRIGTVRTPPPAKYQVPGNANSTDYACGQQARQRSLEISNPSYTPPVEIPPVPVVQIFGVYAVDETLPLGYDPTKKATKLLVNTDFMINLRILPSVGLAGYSPTTFTMTSLIGATSYSGGTGFTGWAAGDNASDYGGEFYRIPAAYVSTTGIATFTVSAGQPTVNTVFGQGSYTISVEAVVTCLSADVVQDGWYTGIPTDIEAGITNTVSTRVPVKLSVCGPPSTTFTYEVPTQSGTATTDATGKVEIDIPILPVGTYEKVVDFSGGGGGKYVERFNTVER